MEQGVEQIRDQAQGGILSFGIVVALWSASVAVRMTMRALNVAYNVEEERPAWKKYPLSVLYKVLLAVLAISAVGLMLIGPQVAYWSARQVGLGSVFVALWNWLRIPAAILLPTAIVAFVYYLFPNQTRTQTLLHRRAARSANVGRTEPSYLAKTFAPSGSRDAAPPANRRCVDRPGLARKPARLGSESSASLAGTVALRADRTRGGPQEALCQTIQSPRSA